MGKIKYRPHRGGLDEAMKEYREFETYDQLKAYVVDEWAKNIDDPRIEKPFTVDDVVIGEVIGNDDRIGWKNVRHVCINRFGDRNYIEMYGCPQCIGWCGE